MLITHHDIGTIDYDELATLKHLAVNWGLTTPIRTSCSEIASTIDISTQTVSRRLQHLERYGLVDRETDTDGQVIVITGKGRELLHDEYLEYRGLFEGDESLVFVGEAASGLGEGEYYISLQGYMDQFETKLGYVPYEGTLNIELGDESRQQKYILQECRSVTIDGWERDGRSYGPVECVPATLDANGESYDTVHILDIERTHHDEDVIEAIAPERLRDVLDIDDGDTVELTLETDTI